MIEKVKREVYRLLFVLIIKKNSKIVCKIELFFNFEAKSSLSNVRFYLL